MVPVTMLHGSPKKGDILYRARQGIVKVGRKNGVSKERKQPGTANRGAGKAGDDEEGSLQKLSAI